MKRLLLVLAVLVVFGALVAACGGGDDSEAVSGEQLTVFAAASLTEVFPQIDPTPLYNFAGSDELAAQIREGAPADVFASANARFPDELFDEDLVEEPQVFATNRLVLIVPEANPAGLDAVEDVAEPGLKLVVAAEGVPVGDYTREVLGTLGLEAALDNVVSNEDDVKGVVSKVSLGEADAGFVYSTDAAVAAEDVEVIELPEGSQPPIEYKIAVVSDSDDQDGAQAFVDLVLSEQGQEQLVTAGFGAP
jgi:molybdate transport system substrate-binding protein